MKITIEKEFTNAGEAAVWLQRFFGPRQEGATVNIVVPPIARDDNKDVRWVEGADGKQRLQEVEPAPKPTPTGEAKPPRKPRNDAGKPRGPYKVNDLVDRTKVNGEASASEPVKDTVASAALPAAAAPTPPNAMPTKEDALAALKRLSSTEGFGVEACRQHLAEFKVNRLSELDVKHYPLFIKQIEDKLVTQ